MVVELDEVAVVSSSSASDSCCLEQQQEKDHQKHGKEQSQPQDTSDDDNDVENDVEPSSVSTAHTTTGRKRVAARRRRRRNEPKGTPETESLRPCVAALREKYAWNEWDGRSLLEQLGYLPENAVRVVCRESSSLLPSVRAALVAANVESSGQQLTGDGDAPVVLQLYPLAVREPFQGNSAKGRKGRRRRGPSSGEGGGGGGDEEDSQLLLEPFPTIYWLTSPALRVAISDLEKDGFGEVVRKRLLDNPEHLEAMRRAHASYEQERSALLSDADWDFIRRRQWERAFAGVGVAGMRNFAAVKCLHTHTAHYLAGNADNVIGRWVTEELCTPNSV